MSAHEGVSFVLPLSVASYLTLSNFFFVSMAYFPLMLDCLVFLEDELFGRDFFALCSVNNEV